MLSQPAECLLRHLSPTTRMPAFRLSRLFGSPGILRAHAELHNKQMATKVMMPNRNIL